MSTKILALLAAAELSATGQGGAVDITTLDGEGVIVLNSAATQAADNTADFKLQESADGSTWTDVANGAFTQVTNAAASFQTKSLRLGELKKNLRLHYTLAGTSPKVIVSAEIVGGEHYS